MSEEEKHSLCWRHVWI